MANQNSNTLRTKGLTATIIFEAQSLNYDEGYGNLSVIKKLHRGSGEVYTYASRQSLRYSIFVQGVREFGWKPSDVEEAGAGDQTVTQLITDIDKSEEGDLFGYMRTNVKVDGGKEVSVLRTTPVRILPAIALESYASDLEMLTNKYQADKIQSNPNIANMEVHRSFYRYTVAIDLHRVGTEQDRITTRIAPGQKTEPKDYEQYEKKLRELNLSATEKAKRVNQLLEIIKTLYRDIKGRREDLKPLFIIGGVYDTCNPFFENLVTIKWEKDKPRIVGEPIKQILTSQYATLDDQGELRMKDVKNETFIGIRAGIFNNQAKDFSDDENFKLSSPEQVIEGLKNQVNAYYGINNES
ncbi:MAG TPA: type I-B CRISPR-associated protein Cas7/Cst2/DevR [Bacteroidota bacterium]|nr:type I-B CRISPR-associated protein Cas7/Cst2/DevR [Bacteroidota bacterium]